MNISELLRWQWDGYPRYHQARTNLLIHIAAVPLFLAGNVALLVALPERSVGVTVVALVAMLLSVALQGHGHRLEEISPEPFTGPTNAISRILLEQWITFPRFVISGEWLRAVRNCA